MIHWKKECPDIQINVHFKLSTVSLLKYILYDCCNTMLCLIQIILTSHLFYFLILFTSVSCTVCSCFRLKDSKLFGRFCGWCFGLQRSVCNYPPDFTCNLKNSSTHICNNHVRSTASQSCTGSGLYKLCFVYPKRTDVFRMLWVIQATVIGDVG